MSVCLLFLTYLSCLKSYSHVGIVVSILHHIGTFFKSKDGGRLLTIILKLAFCLSDCWHSIGHTHTHTSLYKETIENISNIMLNMDSYNSHSFS